MTTGINPQYRRTRSGQTPVLPSVFGKNPHQKPNPTANTTRKLQAPVSEKKQDNPSQSNTRKPKSSPYLVDQKLFETSQRLKALQATNRSLRGSSSTPDLVQKPVNTSAQTSHKNSKALSSSASIYGLKTQNSPSPLRERFLFPIKEEKEERPKEERIEVSETKTDLKKNPLLSTTTLGSFNPRDLFGSSSDDSPKKAQSSKSVPLQPLKNEVLKTLENGAVVLVGQKIGEGNYRRIEVALINNERWAVPMSRSDDNYDMQSMANEMTLLRKAHESKEDGKKYIVGVHSKYPAIELCHGSLYNMTQWYTLNQTKLSYSVGLNKKIRGTYFKQVLQAVHHLHTLGIVHRDIKPQNILIGYDNCIRLCDLADSVHIQSSKTFTGFGTPGYSAPEVHPDRTLLASELPKTDVYSLGKLLIELLGINDFIEGRVIEPQDKTSVDHLLFHMTRSSGSERYSLYQVLTHPFIQKLEEASKDELNKPVEAWTLSRSSILEQNADKNYLV